MQFYDFSQGSVIIAACLFPEGREHGKEKPEIVSFEKIYRIYLYALPHNFLKIVSSLPRNPNPMQFILLAFALLVSLVFIFHVAKFLYLISFKNKLKIYFSSLFDRYEKINLELLK